MATADSIIRVSIIGDAKNLTKALDKADGGLKGFVKKAGLTIGGLVTVDKVFDFLGGALDNADAVGDAMSRLEFTVGKVNADKLASVADSFTKMGLSEPQMLGLEGAFADIGTAIGLNADDITNFADDVVVIADKLHDTDPDNKSTAQFVEDIGKAAGGAKKPLKDLGITIDEAAVTSLALHDSGKDNPKMLTDSEKAAARFKIIMEKLNPILNDATTGSADLRDRQDELRAKFDNLQTKVGTQLQPVLNNLLTWLNDEVDAIGPAADGWGTLADRIVGFSQRVASPLASVSDLIHDLNVNIHNLTGTSLPGIRFNGGAAAATRASENTTARTVQRIQARNGIRSGGIGNSLGGP
jgi:hypothetical protein